MKDAIRQLAPLVRSRGFTGGGQNDRKTDEHAALAVNVQNGVYVPGFFVILWSALLLTALLAAPTGAAEPLVRLGFGAGTRNAGTLGGEARLVEYMPGEGPTRARGIAGMGLSFERSSRSGGSTFEKAGGAALFTDPRLAGLRRFTLALWFRPIETAGPARLLWMNPEWDLHLSGSGVVFKVKSGGKDYPVATARGVGEGWSFVAVAADVDAGRGAVYLGTPGAPATAAAAFEGMPLPDKGAGSLEIGNLGGIRPFKGVLDEVRLYGTVLSEAEVKAVQAETQGTRRSLKEQVVARAESAPTFRASDVCFSTRPGKIADLKTARAFKANRILWVYTSNAEFVKAGHDMGATVQGAVNSIPRTPDLSAYCVDLDGTKLVAPWMVAFDRKNPVKWGCCNQPAYRQAVLDAAKKALDAGVDWMQFDDWSLIVSAHSWGGGCFCDRCMDAFRAYLEKLPPERLKEADIADLAGFDYRKYVAETHGIRDAKTYKEKRGGLPTTPLFEEFQRHSVRAYFQGLRAELDQMAGRRVPLSINANLTNPSQHVNFLADLVDFFLGETWSPKLEDLAICARSALALGKRQVVSPLPHSVLDARLSMAATYALGEHYLVPWDLYMGSDADGIKPRYYGTVEEHGDLFHFVRDHSGLFDGFEATGVAGVLLDTDRYNSETVKRVVRRLLRAQVPFAFVPVGRKYYDTPLDPAQIARFDVVICPGGTAGLAPADRLALEKAAERTAIVADSEITDRELADLAPVDMWGPEGVTVLPRVSTAPGSRTLVLHVLNRCEAEGKVLPLRYLSLGLRPAALLGPKITRATWHLPGKDPRALEVDALPGGHRLILPDLAEWGIAEVVFGE